MSGRDRNPRQQRFRGDSAVPPPLSEGRRRALLERLEAIRDRTASDPPSPAPGPGAPATSTAPTRTSAERRAEERRERSTADRGLADLPRVLETPTMPTPRPRVDPPTAAPRAPSLGRTPDPPGVDPALGQRVDQTIGPDPAATARRAARVPPAPSPSAADRRVIAETHDALDELNSRYFRDLWNSTADRLLGSARSRHDAPMRRLRSEFERLMGRYPEGIPSRVVWDEARRIFDEAYEHARSRWSSSTMWSAVWRNEEATRRLEALQARGVLRITRDSSGRPTGAPHIRQYDPRSGRFSWQPVNIDHAVPLERNPWGVLGRDNLVATTPLVNQRFLNDFSEHAAFPMAVDRFGGAGSAVDDAIEDFVMANGLSRRQRATAAQLAARYGESTAGMRRGRRRREAAGEASSDGGSGRRSRSSESGRRVIRGLVPALSWALELLVGSGRRELYRHSVEELRRTDRLRRSRRREHRLSEFSALPQNLRQTFARVVGDRHPVTITQLGELRQGFETWLETWDSSTGESFVERQAALAATPGQRDDILNDYLTMTIDHMRALQEVHADISGRLAEQDWAALAAEAEAAVDNFDQLLEGELSEFAVDIDDAEYLSARTFRRIANAYRNFHTQLGLLRGLVFDAINRHRRLIDYISELTAD